MGSMINVRINIILETFKTFHYIEKFIHLGEYIDENV